MEDMVEMWDFATEAREELTAEGEMRAAQERDGGGGGGGAGQRRGAAAEDGRTSRTYAGEERERKYMTLVGVLMYLGHGSRGDVLFPVIKSAQVASNPSREKYEQLMVALAYLHATAAHMRGCA